MTIKDIAELAGVSISTVSKIINNKDKHINEATRQRVLAIVKDYNYKPYASVKSSNSTFTIGVIFPEYDDSAFIAESSEILSGILTAAQNNGYVSMIVRSNHTENSERKCLSMLILRNVSAVIWRPLADRSGSDHSIVLQELEHADIPYLIVGNADYPNSIQPSYWEMGHRGAAELIRHKHEKVLFVSHDESERCSQMADGFFKALSDAGIATGEANRVSIDVIRSFPERLADGYTAVFCTNEADSQIMYALLQSNNYRIPENKSLLAVLQHPSSVLVHPQLSGIFENCREFGRNLAKTIIRMNELGHRSSDIDSSPFSYDYIKGETVDIPENHRMHSILCVGTINYDCTILSDTLPQSGTTLLAHSSTYSIGGKGLNQAVGAARLGHRVVLIGKIGDDDISVRIMEGLNKSGVLTHAIGREKKAETGKAFIQLETNGDSTITVVPGANDFVSSKYLDSLEENFDGASFCMITGETSIETVEATCRLCRKHGVKSVYKPAAAKTLPDDIYPLVDYFIPNFYEATQLFCGITDTEELSAYFMKKGCNTVIITMGAKGCYVKSRLEESGKTYPPCNLFPVVDTTGAADAFISTFTSCLAMGYELDKTIQLAQISAAHIVSCIGTAPAMPDWETLKNHAARAGITI